MECNFLITLEDRGNSHLVRRGAWGAFGVSGKRTE